MSAELKNREIEKLIRERLLTIRKKTLRDELAKEILKKMKGK